MNRSSDQQESPFHWGFFLRFGILVGVLMTLILGLRVYTIWHPPTEYVENLTPLAAPKKSDQVVETGLFIQNVYAFEAEKKTFDVDGWVWLKYSKALHVYMKKHAVLPSDLIYFVNQVDDYDFNLDASTVEPILMPDGRYYQRYRFSGHFYVDDLNFRKYPFQTISLPIILDLRGQKLRDDAKPVELLVDVESSGIGPYIDLSGYVTKDFRIAGVTEHLMTRMGNPLAEETGSIAELRLTVNYQKSLNSTFFKQLLPLITVMLITLYSPSIVTMGWEVRLGIPPTILLTLIFLQQSYQDRLPDLHYLTFLDTIYNLCYLINLALFGVFLWGAKVMHTTREEDYKAMEARLGVIDAYFQFFLGFVLIMGIAVDWWFHFVAFDGAS